MKRFDKGYIYSSMLSDLFGSFVIIFIFLKDFFLDESSNPENIKAAIPFFVAAFIVVYIGFVVYRILYYKTSGYELGQTEIKCNRGVFFRKRSVLDYKKIHAINKKQSLFHRIFGVAVLTVDSGSTNTSHQAEITIVEKAKTVDELLNELNALKEGGERAVNEPQEELLLSDKDSLYRFSSKKKMLYTLINIASTSFFTALFGVMAMVVIGFCKLMLQLDSLGSWGQYFLLAVLITLGAMLLFSAFSLIGSLIHSFVGYHDFQITKQGNNIQISFGLLERHTNTFSYDRIKAVKISQSLVQRMLGFASIRLEVIGYTAGSGDDDKNADLGVLVPFCKYEEIDEILGKVLPEYVPEKRQTKAVAFFPFVSWFMLIFGIIISVALLAAVGIMLIFNVPSYIIAAVAIGALVLSTIILGFKIASSALSYKTNGFAARNGKITVYSGGFTKNIAVFMAKNLIAIENSTTPLRQKAGIESYVFHLKTNALSNEIEVRIQEESHLGELEKLLIL